jgi:thiol:disulfide interchange protein DsbD
MSFFADRLRRGLRHIVIAAFALSFALWPALACAVDEKDLLPVDQAFALRAQATEADRIELRWTIAPGYYLYRHRTKAQILDTGVVAGALRMPKGEPHKDEFFGATETYRGSLLATLPDVVDAGGRTLRLKVQYQGCADVGVCYPPQTRTVQVTMPATSSAAAIAQTAETSNETQADEGFSALGRTLSGRGNTANNDGANVNGASAPFGEPGVRTALPETQAFGFEAIAGDGNTVLLRFTPAKGYYLYRDRTTLRLRSDDEPVRLGKIEWPTATPWRDEHFGTVQVYFSQIDVRVPVLRASAKALPIEVDVEFQGCQTDGICYPPMRRKVALTLPAGAKISPDAGARADAQAKLAAATTSTTNATATTSATDSPSPPNASDANNDATATAPALDGATASTNANAAVPQEPVSNAWIALVFALLGGIVLNLMPCVLPVLSLKALGLAGSGETPGKARAHALWYTAGVLVSFLALGGLAIALRKAGMALGWGFQLQQPLVVASLALVMFAFGLSLSGLWYVGGRWTGIGHRIASRSGAVGDFFTGVLAVVVAAPCTAPFMAPALGWAFTAPTYAALLVFLALGLGLALPFLLLGFVPALAQRLPKPGAWMETLKQFLAFPMYLTAIWLMWVLIKQRGADAGGWLAIAALALAFAAWVWRRRTQGARWGLFAALLAVAIVAVALRMIAVLPRPATTNQTVAAQPSGDAELVVVPFSEQRLADLRRADRVVLVNMTADWCISCKANEKAVFGREAFRAALANADAVYMVGDWTDVDPAITAYLQRYRAVGVPLYVIYPRGGGEGRVLPTVLTPAIVEKALAEAAGRRSPR